MPNDKKMAVSRRWLIACNLVTAILLLYLMYHDDYFKRITDRVTGANDTIPITHYQDNYWYKEQTGLQAVYTTEADIVFLGTSLTYRVQWNELLGRNDCVNRGIPLDNTEGMLNRLDKVLAAKPKICFIEGGLNDIDQQIAYDSIVVHLQSIAAILKQNNIIPIITTAPYASALCKEYWPLNYRINYFNTALKKMAKADSTQLLDLNVALAAGMLTRPEYTTTDGVHLNGAGYSKWKELVEQELQKNGIDTLAK